MPHCCRQGSSSPRSFQWTWSPQRPPSEHTEKHQHPQVLNKLKPSEGTLWSSMWKIVLKASPGPSTYLSDTYAYTHIIYIYRERELQLYRYRYRDIQICKYKCKYNTIHIYIHIHRWNVKGPEASVYPLPGPCFGSRVFVAENRPGIMINMSECSNDFRSNVFTHAKANEPTIFQIDAQILGVQTYSLC